MNTAVGKSIQRKDAWDKVTGKAQYADDFSTVRFLSARLLTSTFAHAKINKIDISEASSIQGVKTILTGADCTELFGPILQDRPALAKDVVRYAGEPVALVVAIDEHIAEQAVRKIIVEYEPLPVALTPSQSLQEGAFLIHPQTNSYKLAVTDVYPEQGTNIASSYRIRKGDIQAAFQNCANIIEERFFLPHTVHLAMEVRTARCEISADGVVEITTSSQSPYSVRTQLSDAFSIPSGKIHVKVPFVGGGFGGKAPVMLEILAYLASRSVGGEAVRLTIEREQDMATLPGRIGLEANIKLGANERGEIVAAELKYWLDCGAYTDISPYMTKAIAVDCTGPYKIENLNCDAFCVYTNHTYATSYRSFAHESYTFCIERAMDLLAEKCNIDRLEFRLINAIREGSTTPTQVPYSKGVIGDLTQCLKNLRDLAEWENEPVVIKENTVKAKGIACFWKTENPPTDAISGALVTFNPDGSVNLNTGAVEMGCNCHTHLAQILAEKLKINADKVHVAASVDTKIAPEHWKTVASLTEYMAGQAVVRAADDMIAQLKSNGAQAMSCSVDDVEIANGWVYCTKSPVQFIAFKDIVQGYKSKDNRSIGEPVLGRGGFILKGLTHLDPQTGKGRTGPEWAIGAQVVEIEADLQTCTYRLINATTVIDVGNAINPESMRASVAGGMAMGLSLSTREVCNFDENGIPNNPNLRTYKLMHIGQEPKYRVGFVETPVDDSPYGVRSFSEHGIIGMPAALGNALSVAFGTALNTLPLTPETIWKAR